jgi:hypothetical protein
VAESGKREERINAEFAENAEDAEDAEKRKAQRREKRTFKNGGCGTR